MGYRIAADTGGTFTDVVVATDDGSLRLTKALTTPDRMFDGTREALNVLAPELKTTLEGLLADTDLFIYGTTRATNAIIERTTARTAFFTTKGFPDILLLREGGKLEPFNFRIPYPEPYVPRALTYEIPGRIDAQGNVVSDLDPDAVREAANAARDAGVEAIGVALLWSIANSSHELEVRRLIAETGLAVPVTLSHELNPTIREYRRASSTVIDASLKPLMQEHLQGIEDDLRGAGFRGDLLVVTSSGGCLHAADVAERPLYAVGSGPSMAPIAASTYAEGDIASGSLVVCDAGGTSFDVSLIENGSVKTTREKWLGPRFQGHITGLPSVEVSSIGAGGGSIAWIDEGGLLRVGPQSAGASPGPVCYGRGGTKPTVTDAATVLGYFDPEYFLGGRMPLDRDAAATAIGRHVAEPLGLDLERAADAILAIANETMVAAIREITINQGVDPRECALVAGGGAGGLNAVALARKLGCPQVLVPQAAGALSAAGAQFADIVADFSISRLVSSDAFDFDAVNGALADIDERMDRFTAHLGSHHASQTTRTYSVEARYPFQVWELEVPLEGPRLQGQGAVAKLVEGFHEAHERTFAVHEPGQSVECQYWRGRVTAHLDKPDLAAKVRGASKPEAVERVVYFEAHGRKPVRCLTGPTLPLGFSIEGPAIIEEPITTIVLPPGSRAAVSDRGSYVIDTEVR